MFADAQDSVTLAWQPPPDNGSAITFYQLEMDDGCGGEFHLMHTGQAEPCSAVVEKLQVRVCACVVVCLQQVACLQQSNLGPGATLLLLCHVCACSRQRR